MKLLNLNDRLFKYHLINSPNFNNIKQLKVVNKIGGKSKNSSIYLCHFNQINFDGCLKTSTDNYKDFRLSLRLSSLVLRDINPHFLIIYRLIDRTSTISELATGDLKSFLSSYISIDIVLNTILQVILSIHSFHIYTELNHGDCYHGNFLYHRIEKTNSYFHYKILDNDFYIKNDGYIWMINDFDLANHNEDEKINNQSQYDDFKIAMEAFKKYNKNSSQTLKTLIKKIIDIVWNNNNSFDLILELISVFKLNSSNSHKKSYNTSPYLL